MSKSQDVMTLNAPENMSPAQSSGAESQHKRQQHWCSHSSCKQLVWNASLLPVCIRPNIPSEPEHITAAAFLISAVFLVLVSVVTNMELVQPQCSSLCMLQEAVVQAAVVNAGVWDHQTAVITHVNRVQFTVEARSLKVSKGSVPVLDHTYTWEEEPLVFLLILVNVTIDTKQNIKVKYSKIKLSGMEVGLC